MGVHLKRYNIYISEDDSVANIPVALAGVLEDIKKLVKEEEMDENIKDLVFSNQNYSCKICKCKGEPLKIAYLKDRKENSDISNLNGLCEDCYNVYTKDKVIIDMSVAKQINNYENDMKKCIEFLSLYYEIPDNKNEFVSINIKNWLYQYNKNDLLRR